ncbi:MAG: class 1 isoprenoid biosynthesis enzyme [Clostridia bacterium]|nr:class 1 isoprenoid biosynthesis enzyme [Clostridia bacterium]
MHDFDKDFEIIMSSVHKKVSAYPVIFQDDALSYLEKYNILNESFNRNPMFLLLPFWLQKPFGLEDETCRSMSEGFMYLWLHILIQDAVMDISPGEYKANLLPLSNLFFTEFIEQFRLIFKEDSVFWAYFKEYLVEWAESVIWEQKDSGQKKVYSKHDLILVARKAAPLKVLSAGACLLGGKSASIDTLSEIIDRIVLTFQMMDDISDWKEDHAVGNCTYFISQVMDNRGIADFWSLNETHVNAAKHFGGVLYKLFEIAEDNRIFIQSEAQDYPYLLAYHESLYEDFRKIVVRSKKSNYMRGGLVYLLKDKQS